MSFFGFGKNKTGGIINTIRCDESEYLIWKWRPKGNDANTTSRENSIRWGSSLRVKDGEVAVFVYSEENGPTQEFITGPTDCTLETSNLPILAGVIGAAYRHDSPFQAEVYFINTAGITQIRFAVPYFDVFDPRFPDHGVPVSVRGSLTFSLVDYKNFVKLHRLIQFDLIDFERQIKSALIKYVKSIVINVPRQMGIPLVQMESQILSINDAIAGYLKPRLETEFGVVMKSLDIDALEIDKEDPYYEELRDITAGIMAETARAQSEINIKNLRDTQAINAANMEENLRIQREEAQRAQRLQTESQLLGAHSINQQADVLKAGAQSLGNMGNMNMGSGGGDGLNPAGMMTGMMMGGAMGQQMAGLMNNMSGQIQQGANTPPPLPVSAYYVAVNGAQSGPFQLAQLQQMAQNAQFTKESLVWKEGMPQWSPAGTVPELVSIFATPNTGAVPPPLPQL